VGPALGLDLLNPTGELPILAVTYQGGAIDIIAVTKDLKPRYGPHAVVHGFCMQ
jgi:hypothetical protein